MVVNGVGLLTAGIEVDRYLFSMSPFSSTYLRKLVEFLTKCRQREWRKGSINTESTISCISLGIATFLGLAGRHRRLHLKARLHATAFDKMAGVHVLTHQVGSATGLATSLA